MSRPWYSPRPPGEIDAHPWLHEEAIAFLENILQPDWRVLEHGAGGSTLWLAKRAKEVVSIEHNPAWRQAVSSLAPANVTLLQTFFLEGKRDFDLFFIDGERLERGVCLKRACQYVKPGGWVVLDNANRPEYREERLEFSKQAVLMDSFDNNIETSLYFITEFWQCASE